MRIVHGATVTLDTLDNGEFVNFFTAIGNHVLPAAQGGHVDLFLPLAATGEQSRCGDWLLLWLPWHREIRVFQCGSWCGYRARNGTAGAAEHSDWCRFHITHWHHWKLQPRWVCPTHPKDAECSKWTLVSNVWRRVPFCWKSVATLRDIACCCLVKYLVVSHAHPGRKTPVMSNSSFLTVESEWLKSPEKAPPPTHYFCSRKLNVWTNTADQVQEACKVTKKVVGRYFEQRHRDVVSQLVGACLLIIAACTVKDDVFAVTIVTAVLVFPGQIIFDATGQADIQGTHQLADVLVDGMICLGKEQNVSQ